MRLPSPWALMFLFCALFWGTVIGLARAQDIQYCVRSEGTRQVVIQCQNGTVTVVDSINDKVVVCSTNSGDTPRCQTLPLGDK